MSESLTREARVAVVRSSGYRRLGRVIAGVAVVAITAGFVVVNRAEVPNAVRAVRHANLWWMALGVVASVAFTGLHAAARRAALATFGVTLSPSRAVLTSAVAQSLNIVAKSGGMAGLAVYRDESRRTNQPSSLVTGGYMLGVVLGDASFAMALIAAIVVLVVDGRFTSGDAIGVVVVGVYFAVVASVVVAATRSRSAIRSLHALPARLRRRAPDHTAADELFDAIQQTRARPASVVPIYGLMLLIELVNISMVWICLAAYGQHVSIAVPVVGYGVSVLFSLISVLPAGIGFAEASLGAVFVSFGVAGSVAAVVVLTYRILETWLPLMTGILVAAYMASTRCWGEAVRGGNRNRFMLRSLAAATALVGVLDVVLAAERHPFIGIGRFRVAHRATIEGSRYVLLVSGLALIASSRQLRRGKHRAWQLAVITLMASLIAHPIHNGDIVGVVPTAMLATFLVLASSRFTARSDPAKASEGVVWLLLGELGVLIYGSAGLFLLDHDFAQENGLSRSITQALRLLFLLPVDAIDTVTRHGDWFVASVRVLALLVLFIAIWHFVQPVVVRNTSDRAERARARAILEQYATTGIAYFHLLGDKRLFIANDGRSLLSYRLVGGTAIALGEPIGATDSCLLLAREFEEFCDLHGWRLAYHQVAPQGTQLLETLGYKSLKIGEEAIVPVQEFSIEGSHRKRLRNKNRQLAKEGLTIEELSQPIDDATMAELREVSDGWLADGGHRERTFTLGWFDADYLRDTTVLVARSANGRIEAFVNILPVFRGTDGNFDLMRRRPEAPNGVMDFMFVHLIDRFRDAGLTGMTLGFAPLAHIEGDGLIARALRTLYDSENKAFNFKGLYAFKSKWDPRWEPRTLVYRSDLELPQIAYTVARVGEKVETAPRFLRAGLHH